MGYSPEHWQSWWRNPQDVQLYQFMGKDNIFFHTVIFPACLLGTGRDYTLLHHVSTTEYLNYEGGKFSKSRGTGVFGDQAQRTGIPSEVWRYYLLANRPEQSDSVFTWADFAAKVNDELNKNLGNFVQRTLSLAFDNFEGATPGERDARDERDGQLVAEADRILAEFNAAIKNDAGRLVALTREINEMLVKLADKDLEKEVRGYIKDYPSGVSEAHNRLVAILEEREKSTVTEKKAS